jgi:spermidine/putrescine transport system substrate-binding protein
MSQERQALEALVRAQLRGPGRGVSRRGFLRGASLATLAVGVPSLLSACGTEAARQTTESCQTDDKSETEKTLAISNWPLYIDQKRVKEGGERRTVYPTIEAFQEESGITVEYTTDFNDNNEFFGIV